MDIKTKTEIYDFVKKETKYLHSLKFKKYFKNFNDLDDFVEMFEGEKINRNRHVKINRRKLKKKKGNYSKSEQVIMTPFEEFFNDFNVHILTKEDVEQDSKKVAITKQLGMDITKNWNPKIEFTEERYLVCLLPKFDSSKATVPKYGEFMMLQILEKKGNKWKVYSSWN
ncbi:hypothetical protein [Flagellimonas onchidii]|uniref:hypothetical protein n=1 Tax=Flagellimonas onchidii TaxID=2562684 RepID=UPI0010A62FED|nr:hypothetical protein [Allomuricauda onchidii]